MIVLYFLLGLLLLLTILMCWQESRRRQISFVVALLLCLLLTPLIGYFIVFNRPMRNAGCAWCGNPLNEAEYCGICGKNSEGKLKEQAT